MKSPRLCLIVSLALLLLAAPVASAALNPNPGFLPPDARVHGLTYREWSAVWWQHILLIPASESPVFGHFGPDCYFGRVGNVGLVVASAIGSYDLQCEVPAGMALFWPIVTAECSTLEPPPWYGGNEEELRTCAAALIPANLVMQVSVDGEAVQNMSDYLVLSPLYDFTVPEDNVLGVPAGSGQSVAIGAWLMLAPLSVGEHTISIYVPDWAMGANFLVEVTPGH